MTNEQADVQEPVIKQAEPVAAAAEPTVEQPVQEEEAKVEVQVRIYENTTAVCCQINLISSNQCIISLV